MPNQGRGPSPWQAYAAILQRMPGVRWVQVDLGPDGKPRVQMVADIHPQPARFLREVVSALRSSGWVDVEPGLISIAHVPRFSLEQEAASKLEVAGYAVSHGGEGVRAECRLVSGGMSWTGHATASTALEAMALAAVEAINQGQGHSRRLCGVAEVLVGGVPVVVATISQGSEQVASGCAVSDAIPIEEAVIRAVLGAELQG